MPYIDTTRARLDPDISTTMSHLLKSSNKRSGKYFFFRFLTLLYGALEKNIERSAGEMHYADFNHLGGAFSCASKELWRRWRELVLLRPRVLAIEKVEKLADRYVADGDFYLLSALVTNLAERYDQDINKRVGEVNYTISEVANILVNSGRGTPQELLDIALAAENSVYFTHVGPHEDKVILKNGDTAGFKTFYKKFCKKK